MTTETAKIKVANRLFELFPETFFFKSPVPLKIGILEDLIDARPITEDGEPMSKPTIKRFLRWYCRRDNYLKAIIRSDVRIDLQGAIVENSVISNYEKEKAQEQLLKQKAEKRAKKKQNLDEAKSENPSEESTESVKPLPVVHEAPENLMIDKPNRPILSLKIK